MVRWDLLSKFKNLSTENLQATCEFHRRHRSNLESQATQEVSVKNIILGKKICRLNVYTTCTSVIYLRKLRSI
jgi:hypothetical protein